jgi:hypothetical protein
MCYFSSNLHVALRPAKLRAFQEEMAAKNGELRPGERRLSGRKRDEYVRLRTHSTGFSSFIICDLSSSFIINAKMLFSI